MFLPKGKLISDGVVYFVEFTNAEEVAEKGEHARKERLSLPEQFDMDNDKMMETLFVNAQKVMKEKDFDTFVLQRETVEEFLFFEKQ